MRGAATMFSLMTIVVAFFVGPIISLAATVTNDPVADYSSSWKLNRFGGKDWTDSQVWMKKADGVTAFCIEHGVDLWGGSDFTPSELTIAEKDRLSLISYYGYQLDPTVLNYAVTQNIVWEELGDSLLSTTIPNYAAHKNQILSKVNKHNAKPSFNGQSVEINVGDSITLTDSAGVLNNYQHLVENSAKKLAKKSMDSYIIQVTEIEMKNVDKLLKKIEEDCDVLDKEIQLFIKKIGELTDQKAFQTEEQQKKVTTTTWKI